MSGANEYVKSQAIANEIDQQAIDDAQGVSVSGNNQYELLLAGFASRDLLDSVIFGNFPDAKSLQNIQDDYNYLKELELISTPFDTIGINTSRIIDIYRDELLFKIKSTLGYKASGVASVITSRKEMNITERRKGQP